MTFNDAIYLLIVKVEPQDPVSKFQLECEYIPAGLQRTCIIMSDFQNHAEVVMQKQGLYRERL